MKLKHFLLIGTGFMLFGGILVAGTYTAGAQKTIVWENGPKLLDMKEHTEKFKANEIKNLVIQAENQEINIRQGLDFEVTTQYEKSDEPKVVLKDETLSIRAKGKQEYPMQISLEDTHPEITITVPKEISLSDITIESSNNRLTMTDITAKNLAVDAYSDSWLSFIGLKTDSVTVKDRFSSVDFSRLRAKKGNFTGEGSNFYFYDSALTDSSTIVAKNGSVRLNDVDVPGYQLTLAGDSTFQVNNETREGSSFEKGNSKKGLTIEGKDTFIEWMDEKYQNSMSEQMDEMDDMDDMGDHMDQQMDHMDNHMEDETE